MNERLFLLSLAEKECSKQLEKAQKQVEKTSAKLFSMNDMMSAILTR